MSPTEEDFIRFYRDAVIAGHDDPAAETMRHFNLSHDYVIRLLNEPIAGYEGQDTGNWKSGERCYPGNEREIARLQAPHPSGALWLHEIKHDGFRVSRASVHTPRGR